jgi:hypothetical protein
MPVQSATLNPGVYYIGDPAYVLTKDYYDAIMNQQSNSSKIKHKIANAYGVVASTNYGDGIYSGSNNFKYRVDSGQLGIIPEDWFVAKVNRARRLGTFLVFKNKIKVKVNNGNFLIRGDKLTLKIITSPRWNILEH